MKVKLFTHTDLDGVGCYVVAAQAFGKENVDVTYCDYDNVNLKLTAFLALNEMYQYDLVLITDISVDEVVADMIDLTVNKTTYYSDVDMMPRKLILLDHHATASWLNKYWWASVAPVKAIEPVVTRSKGFNEKMGLPQMAETIKTAGTSMLYDYCVSNGYLGGFNLEQFKFVEMVRRWDTWDWMNIHGGEETPKTLNSYLYLIGRERFANRFINNPSLDFNSGEKLVLELEAERIKTYIKNSQKGLVKHEVGDYKIGLVFAEQYQSELGNAIANNNPDIDFAVIINMATGSISYRGVKDDINLGEILEPVGGGGHAKAAGSKLYKEDIGIIVNYLSDVYLSHIKGRE